ncbi:MAG: hypothetical protein A2V84_05510 [Chloroflexi bacterium RBG_16_70_13]|nr:MAG: hypothetical protein A2V84_05510 [Chloroflexi bacterium RBG_16_70_13]
MKRAAFLVSTIALLTVGMATPVLAASPGNDAYAGRTVIDSIPFAESVDTTEATSDADDAEANAGCGAPAIEASVWYEISATADGVLVVDVSSSTYAAGVIVATGAPGGLTFVTCGPFAVGFEAAAGETYLILAFDFEAGAGNGGTLNITVAELPPPPVVELTVDPTGHFNAWTGSATITGVITCTGGEGPGKIGVQLSQSVGRFKFSGEGGAEFACDGTTQPWTAEVTSASGKFAGGKATVSVFAFACGLGGCSEDRVERAVMLRK